MSSLASVSNNPLSIDKIKLSEKLQAVSPLDRLFIPEEFSVLALSYLNRKPPSIANAESQFVSDGDNGLNPSINRVNDKSDIILPPNGISQNSPINLVSQDFIIPPSIEYPAVTLGHKSRMEEESKVSESTQKLLATPLGLELVEELEDWLDELM